MRRRRPTEKPLAKGPRESKDGARMKQFRVVFMGRKPGAAWALDWLIAHGHSIPAVIFSAHGPDTEPLTLRAHAAGIPVMTDSQVYATLAGDASLFSGVDLVISY